MDAVTILPTLSGDTDDSGHFIRVKRPRMADAFGWNRKRDVVRLSNSRFPRSGHFDGHLFADLRPSITRIYHEDLNDPLK